MATKITLHKESSESEIKAYFHAVLKLSESDNEFPINLDDVWPIVYTRKADAMRELKKNFIECIDFSLRKNAQVVTIKELQSGVDYQCFLSLSCMEFFIARKVRPVFDVYRTVFHRVAAMHTPAVILSSDRRQRLKDLIKLQALSKSTGIQESATRNIIDGISRCIESVDELEFAMRQMNGYKFSSEAVRSIVLAFLGRSGFPVDEEDPFVKALEYYKDGYYDYKERLENIPNEYWDRNW